RIRQEQPGKEHPALFEHILAQPRYIGFEDEDEEEQEDDLVPGPDACGGDEWRLSMNRRFGVPALAGPDRLKAGHETSCAPQSGSWSQCMRKKTERGLSMNRPVR